RNCEGRPHPCAEDTTKARRRIEGCAAAGRHVIDVSSTKSVLAKGPRKYGTRKHLSLDGADPSVPLPQGQLWRPDPRPRKRRHRGNRRAGGGANRGRAVGLGVEAF